MAQHFGSVVSSDPRAAGQAKSIGATIGGDGWWYRNGKRLSPQEADALTQQAKTAINTNDNAHGEKARDLWGRASDTLSNVYAATGLNKIKIGGTIGGILERNKSDIAATLATVLAGGNPMAGAAVKAGIEGAKRGSTGIDAAKGFASGYGVGNATQGAMLGSTDWYGAGSDPLGTVKGAITGAYRGGNAMTAAAPPPTVPTSAPTSAATTLPTQTGSNDMGSFGDMFKGLFTGQDGKSMNLADWAKLLEGGYKGYAENQSAQSQQEYNNNRLKLEEEIQRQQQARLDRQQTLSEEDRKRMLAIYGNRDAELSPVRQQLMSAITGGPSTLFGGSVTKGLGTKGFI